ncbi:MAG: YqaE/Pmp3 family membrane protein [Bacteroidia bacterium]
MKKIFGTLIIVGILASCSVDKRLYRPGYNVNWNKSTANVETNKKATTTTVATNELIKHSATETYSEETLTASNNNLFVPVSKPKNILLEATKNTGVVELSASNSMLKNSDIKTQHSTKELKKAFIKEYKNVTKTTKSKIDDTLLYLLLILLVPFGTTISMYLYEGSQWTSRVTTNLILTLLCGIPGIIHALVVIFGKK